MRFRDKRDLAFSSDASTSRVILKRLPSAKRKAEQKKRKRNVEDDELEQPGTREVARRKICC